MTKEPTPNRILTQAECDSEWTRTTVVLREEYLQKLKILSWWEKTTLKELFDEMIKNHLSSQNHLDRLFQEREKNIQKNKAKG